MQDSNRPQARFVNRLHAGYELATDLQRFLVGQNPIILAIPRGGVPVAAALARSLETHLDLIIPRRIELPGEGDLTLGAVTPDRTLVINKELVERLNLSDEEVEQLSLPAWAEAQRTQQLYRKGRPYPDLRGRTAVIVDDRLTTGYSMMAAVVAARKLEPERVVVAVPVSYLEGIERVRGYVDELLSLEITTEPKYMASRYYADWASLTDQEVVWTMEHFWADRPPQGYNETF